MAADLYEFALVNRVVAYPGVVGTAGEARRQRVRGVSAATVGARHQPRVSPNGVTTQADEIPSRNDIAHQPDRRADA